jgi:nitroreductase
MSCPTEAAEPSHLLAEESHLPAGVWSFQLAARARGLGSAWTTFHLVHERQIAELLGIPDTVTQTALLPVAYYAGDTFRPAAAPPCRGDHLLQPVEADDRLI